MDEPGEVLKTAGRWLAEGRRICVATVIRRVGSAPREVGAKMALTADGEMAGSIGGGRAEKLILEAMNRAIKDGRPAVIDLDLSGRSDDLDAMCGGNISVFIEPMGEAKRLVVIGAGHVGVALACLARENGFAVTVVDDRGDYLADPRLKDHAKTLCALPGGSEPLNIDETSFVVICTRGHKLDKEWLGRIIDLRPRYLGMLGSKHKTESIFDSLENEGVDRKDLRRVRAPVGLDIGALTPSEIAVSIVAELISEWRKTGPEGG